MVIIYHIIFIINFFIIEVELVIVFNRLWETMKTKNISTYILREKFNIESRTIRRLKSNQNVTTDTLNKLCNILECKLEDIAEYISDNHKKLRLIIE